MRNDLGNSGERGSILLEFLGYGLLLQVVTLGLFIQVINQQSYQLAAESIARHGMRSFVISQTEPSETANQILDDFGIESKPETSLQCQPDCFSVGSQLKLRVTLQSSSAESVWIR